MKTREKRMAAGRRVDAESFATFVALNIAEDLIVEDTIPLGAWVRRDAGARRLDRDSMTVYYTHRHGRVKVAP